MYIHDGANENGRISTYIFVPCSKKERGVNKRKRMFYVEVYPTNGDKLIEKLKLGDFP